MAKGKRYSVTYDMEQARKINHILLSYPDITRKVLCKTCITNAHRLKYLEQEGLIKLPPPMDRGLRNGLKINEGKNNEVSISM
jgi:hypothetical protein